VPHSRLLKKVWDVGVPDKLLEWITSFVGIRNRRVRVEGNFSDWEQVWSGVSQDFVLGPLLFLIFLSELPDKLA
jgi:Reverse transcriptase (RNA-dependent DNA polymerase)